jgi:predicted DNA-binding transcriptional regulator AlpA
MERRLLRLVEVQRLTTLGRTRIYELVAEDRFPQPMRLGPRRARPGTGGHRHAPPPRFR